MTVSFSQFIQAGIRDNGQFAVSAIQILPIMHCLTVLSAIKMCIAGIHIPMHNVIAAIPEEFLIKIDL
jgi:hypothetical protein